MSFQASSRGPTVSSRVPASQVLSMPNTLQSPTAAESASAAWTTSSGLVPMDGRGQ